MVLIPSIYHLLSLYNMSFTVFLFQSIFFSLPQTLVLYSRDLTLHLVNIDFAMTLPFPIVFSLASPTQIGRFECLKENAKFELFLEVPPLESMTSTLAKTLLPSSKCLCLCYLFPFSRASSWKDGFIWIL